MTSTPWDGNSRGLGGLKQKCLKKPGGGGVGYGYFLELHILEFKRFILSDLLHVHISLRYY